MTEHRGTTIDRILTRKLKALLRNEGILHVSTHVMAFVYIGAEAYCLYTRAWWLFLASLVASLTISYLMHEQQQRIMRIVQRIFDLRANIIVRRVIAGKPPVYSLFLRPFHADGGLTDRIGSWSTDPLEQLEPKLALSMEPLAPLITIFPEPAKPPPSTYELWTADRDWINSRSACYGGGRVQIEHSEWKIVVRKLMLGAAAIFVVPGHTNGSMWEIGLLQRSSLLLKTIWIMPPTKARGLSLEDWNKIIQCCYNVGLKMPAHKKGGRFFTLDMEGNLKNWEFYNVNGRRALRGVIIRLLLAGLANPEFLEGTSNVCVAADKWRRR